MPWPALVTFQSAEDQDPPPLSGGIQPRRFRPSHPLLSVFSCCILGPKVQRGLPPLFSAEELGWNWGEQGEGGGQPGELPTLFNIAEKPDISKCGLSTPKGPAVCQPPPKYRDEKALGSCLSRREVCAYGRVLDGLIGSGPQGDRERSCR